MFDEKICLENLKQIVSEYADDENLKNLSLEELRSGYTQIADNLYHISVSNRLKFKNMLWNIDNLKPEIQSKFQARLFNTWLSIYTTSIESDQTKVLPESNKQDPIPLTGAEERFEINAREQPADITRKESIASKKQKTVASSEDEDLVQKETPAKTLSHPTAIKPLAPQYKNDWFDKLLDFFAAIVGSVSKIRDR